MIGSNFIAVPNASLVNYGANNTSTVCLSPRGHLKVKKRPAASNLDHCSLTFVADQS